MPTKHDELLTLRKLVEDLVAPSSLQAFKKRNIEVEGSYRRVEIP